MTDRCCSRDCISRDEFESRMEHTMRWFERLLWPREAISDIQADTAYLRIQAGVTSNNLADLKERMIQMAANFDELNADLATLATGYQSLQAANAILQAAVDAADADKAQAVADAIAADDAIDQAAVDAADAVVESVLNPAPPADVPPAE